MPRRGGNTHKGKREWRGEPFKPEADEAKPTEEDLLARGNENFIPADECFGNVAIKKKKSPTSSAIDRCIAKAGPGYNRDDPRNIATLARLKPTKPIP